MTFLTAVTAAFVLLAPPQHASAVPTHGLIYPEGGRAPAARYVRLRLAVTSYGIPGRGEIVVDRTTGRFVRRFDAGPVSEREGWDGTRAWRADATGMARVQGNVDERAAIVEWARVLAPAGATGAHAQPSRPAEIARDPRTGDVSVLVRHVGQSIERTAFTGYHGAGGFVVPSAIADTSDNGVWSARVLAVETPASLPAGAFAPPPEPHDASLRGVDSVSTIGDQPIPVIGVSVNGGAPLRFVLDTGGQNAITPDAARRAGMELVGEGTVGGAGAGLAKIHYASARSVRVGRAEMRDQPFVVIDFGQNAPIDGIVG
ncbi:MAG: hypothetical protein JWO66_549 [Candidatus Eremiobacteraeota bacterium]|nr:hypothetical protein [Candidatus Eremiobacteraeota bacterium]